MPHAVLAVGLPPQTGIALDIVLQTQGFGVIEAPGPGVARMALAAGAGIRAVVCRCTEIAEDGSPFPTWLARNHHGIGLVYVCSTTWHDHRDLPATCQVLIPPFDAADVARAMAETRLDTFFRVPVD